MTGIGGQGVQLAASVLAGAAVAEGREVQLFGSYGGMMRGGATEASIVVADGPVEAPPTIGAAWSAVVMHREHAEHALASVRRDGVLLLNASVFDADLDRPPRHVLRVRATDLAVDVGNVMAASMVMLGAYAAATGLVGMDSLVEAVRSTLPAYRAQHVELNQRALHAGAGAVRPMAVPAWPVGSLR